MTHNFVPKYAFGYWNQVLGPIDAPDKWVLPKLTSTVVVGRSSEQISEAHRADPIIGSPIEGTAQRRPGWLDIENGVSCLKSCVESVD